MPVFGGAVQVISMYKTPSWLPGATVGAAGLAGGSSTSVTVIVSVLLTDNARAPVPPVAVTVTI